MDKQGHETMLTVKVVTIQTFNFIACSDAARVLVVPDMDSHVTCSTDTDSCMTCSKKYNKLHAAARLPH